MTAANPSKNEFSLSFGGKTLTFCVGARALTEAQELIGTKTGQVPKLNEMLAGVVIHQRMLYVHAFLWAGLRKYHADYTPDMVFDLLDQVDPAETQALLVALGMTTVPAKEDADALAEGASGNPRTAQTIPPRRRRGANGVGSTSKHAASV